MKRLFAALLILIASAMLAPYPARSANPKPKAARGTKRVTRQNLAIAPEVVAEDKDEKDCLQRDLPEGGVKWTYEKGRNPDCRIDCADDYELSGSALCKKEEAAAIQQAEAAAAVDADTLALMDVLRLDLENRQKANAAIEKLNGQKEKHLEEGHYDALLAATSAKYAALTLARRNLKSACNVKTGKLDEIKSALNWTFGLSLASGIGGTAAAVSNFVNTDYKTQGGQIDTAKGGSTGNQWAGGISAAGTIISTAGSVGSTIASSIASKSLSEVIDAAASCQDTINKFFNEHPEYLNG